MTGLPYQLPPYAPAIQIRAAPSRSAIFGDRLPEVAAQSEVRQIDETLVFEVSAMRAAGETKAAIRRRG
jgi:hypothetical protein